MKRPEKHENVLFLANDCIAKGRYVSTFHAENRQLERDITLLDALYVIKTGHRVPKHDQYKEEWRAWNYALQGKTLQGDTARVIVSFDEHGLLIITVINLSQNP